MLTGSVWAGSHSATSLFRTNTFATKFMSVFSRIYGQKYLQQVLVGPIGAICASTQSYEVRGGGRAGFGIGIGGVVLLAVSLLARSLLALTMSRRAGRPGQGGLRC